MSHFEWWHKIPMVVKNRIVKLMLANSYFSNRSNKKKKRKNMGFENKKKFNAFFAIILFS
jgi:hypothetical protein